MWFRMKSNLHSYKSESNLEEKNIWIFGVQWCLMSVLIRVACRWLFGQRNGKMLVGKAEQKKPQNCTLSEIHGTWVLPGKVLCNFPSFSGLSLNVYVRSQRGKEQTGRKTEWNIKKNKKTFQSPLFLVDILPLCTSVDKAEGVHCDPAGVYALHGLFFFSSWRMFSQ